MSEDREYARVAALPDWIRAFADQELRKEGNPFDDIRNMFKQKNELDAVEARVEELQKQVGLKVEKQAAQKDDIFGGFGDNEPDEKFDPDQLEKGIRVELEHTNDPAKAKEIAKDHLTESKDFKGSDGGKYYDKLDNMEEKIEEELTKGTVSKRKARLLYLIKVANRLEDIGETRVAKIIDNLICKLAEHLAKDKEEPKFIKKHPELERIIEEVCMSRGGQVDIPAIVHMLKNDFLKEEKLSDKDNDELEEYVKKCIKKARKPFGDEKDVSGMNYVVFVINEDDGNNEVFNSPTRS